MVRVLHLRDSPWIDGPGRTILKTAQAIDRKRIDYHVGAFVPAVGADHTLASALRNDGLPVHRIVDDGLSLWAVVEQVKELVDELRIDVLHTSEFRSNVVGLMCGRARPVKLFSTAHGWIANDIRGKTYRFADKFILRNFNCVIFVSEAMRRLIPEWWLPKQRTPILRNAIDIAEYGRTAPVRVDRQIGPETDTHVLSVGRLSAEKGQEILLRAVARIARSHPRIRVSFAGIGDHETVLRRLTTELGLERHVAFLGYVSDMPQLYSQADLVVQSSVTEGLPNVMLEATFLRVPVVATAVGGTAEVIGHGINGWLAEPSSVESLELGIRAFLEHPEWFRRMARSGRTIVEQNFSFSARTARQMALYERFARG